MRCLVAGLAGVIDEPVFLARAMRRICGLETVFLSEGTDPRRPHPGLEADIRVAPRHPLTAGLFLLRQLLAVAPVMVEQYLCTGSTIRDLLYTLILICWPVKRIVHCVGGEILHWESHSKLRRLTVRLALRSACVCICKEPYMLDYLRKFNICSADKAVLIPNAIDPDFYTRRCYSLTNRKTTTFLFFNSFKNYRNLKVLIQAANEVIECRKNVFFLIVGARSHREYDRAVSQVKNRDRIAVLGLSNEKEFYFSLADVFILPADHVYLNVALLEAMSLGLCPVLSDVQWASAIVEPGESGVLVPNRDPQALAEALIRLADDPQARRRMGEAAAHRVRERFGVDGRARRHFQVYADVLARRKGYRLSR